MTGYGEVSDPGSVPRPGDLSACTYCLTPLEYTEGLGLRILDLEHADDETRAASAEAVKAAREFHDFLSKRRRPD